MLRAAASAAATAVGGDAPAIPVAPAAAEPVRPAAEPPRRVVFDDTAAPDDLDVPDFLK